MRLRAVLWANARVNFEERPEWCQQRQDEGVQRGPNRYAYIANAISLSLDNSENEHMTLENCRWSSSQMILERVWRYLNSALNQSNV